MRTGIPYQIPSIATMYVVLHGSDALSIASQINQPLYHCQDATFPSYLGFFSQRGFTLLRNLWLESDSVTIKNNVVHRIS
jgi:hypothetical protein